MRIDDRILNAPCVFCNYSGPRYWSALSHDINCPFCRVSGKNNRRKTFKNAVRKQSVLLEGLRSMGELLIADPDDVI